MNTTTIQTPKEFRRDNQGNQLFDVLIYNIETRIVDAVAGSDLRLSSGHRNAERRLETVEERLNDSFAAGIFDAGFYAKGEQIPESDPGM